MFQTLFTSVYHYSLLHRSLNAIVAQLKNCPFGGNTTIELKKSNNYIRHYRYICYSKYTPLDAITVDVAVLTPNGNLFYYATLVFS